MSATRKKAPSEEGKISLETLQKVVVETLEKKRRLGQYAVVWRDGKPVEAGGETRRQPETLS